MTEQHDHQAPAVNTEGCSTAAGHSESNERRKPAGGRREGREGRPRGGPRRGSKGFGGGRPHHRSEEPPDPKIIQLIREVEEKLSSSHAPVQIPKLSPFERKQMHRHFERKKTLYETKTYRDGDDHVLWIFPVANLKKFVESKAQEALDSGEDVALPPMSSYERFIVHNVLKEFGSIETTSVGEGAERHIEIHPKRFGRGLKRIAKKIKLF
ncbi:MAG: hypothetical protein ONB48_21200 [candidate division KSB1 bacterium]|nr:hypothetical protein [candidate division KSB1 bacterium]MDZ7288167.1 hypothetical protein [candidate division KSB1 bacterium]MDZ7300320.1 hypothetical protein [candidate division KSB1 bacterium]MDZ7308674.1 hypothetical protein [candidate division KSB1 bacterium]MDZ7351320.1 hypothetical protein [candidate division KSB1 bacterium]